MIPKVGCVYRMMRTKLPWIFATELRRPFVTTTFIEIDVKTGREPVCFVLEVGKWNGMLAMLVLMSDGRFGQLRYLNEDDEDFEELV